MIDDPKKQVAADSRLSDDCWSACTEHFRSLRTRVKANFGNEKNKVVLVTSSVPKEGKTTVAVNLARSLAQVSQSTLLVDCDMRRSMVHAHMGVRNGPGLRSLLERENAAAGRVVKQVSRKLSVLTAGLPCDSAAELLSTDRMPAILRELRETYDFVVLDTPPVLPVTDTVILAKEADGLLMVIRCGETPREVTREALDQLRDRTLLGAVLNGVTVSRRQQSYYNYY